ncbi:MAG: hypothetical protein NZ483_02110 [Verrucomicrobiae bacterium]|nr:hypothetical protein [Verrucomicrobiae bacterium]
MLQMPIIFLGLVFWNLVLFGVTIWLGIGHYSLHWQHQAVGVLTGIYTCLTHCIVMMHFMGTGKGIREAVTAHRLADDPETGYTRRARRFKGQTSGHATLACVVILVAVWLGGWMDTSKGNLTAHLWHKWFSWVAVLYNLYVFAIEYRVIRQNTDMIREINQKLHELAH